MPQDVISHLQAVKQAEEAKSHAITHAREEAAARIRRAEAEAAAVESNADSRLKALEPEIRAQVDARTAAALEAIDNWSRERGESLKAASGGNRERVSEMIRRLFLEEWL